MKIQVSKYLVALSLFGTLGVGIAFADAGSAIVARQACMKANGSGMKVMVPMVKGEKPYDAAEVQKALDAMGTACADWANFWPADSMAQTPLKHRASEAIWKDAKGFADQGASYYTAFTALKATKDEAGFKAAFGDLGKGCGGCHEKFRAPE